MSAAAATGDLRFGRFVLQSRERRLLADGHPVPLEPRAFDLLATLAESAGRLVTKDELLARIWPGRIVEDGNLHVQVSALRKVLGKSAIATVVGRGYRFEVKVAAAGTQAPRAGSHGYALPRPLASFVGREDDLELLATGIDRARLVTLSGIGGCGKTRLALKLAERVAASFPGGVCFVDLSVVAEPEGVAPAVALAADVREPGDSSIADTLALHFAGARTLLILDNCEHLLDASATLVARLLAASASLCVLVTSRERLGIAGEWVVPVRPLTLPPATATRDPVAAMQFESVRLFVERASQVAPEFALHGGNAAAVAEICRALDGIPLALELAAALAALLSVEQIRERLVDRFRLLTGGSRVLSRHQTLLGTLQSSYECLAPREQALLQLLSVFAGGWTLDSVAAVAGHVDDIETMQGLGRLVDKSLLQVERAENGPPRYSMLETVRHYAQDRLLAAGGEADLRSRHLAHFVAFAKLAQSHLFGNAMRSWLERIDAELPNLFAAHAWCDHAPDGAQIGLELATNLRSYWLARGLFASGQRIYDEALARPGVAPRAKLRGKALYALGQHHYVRGRLRDALAPTQEALSIAREHGDDELVVYCLDRLCLASSWLGDAARAREYGDEELAVAQRTGNRRLVGFAFTARGAACRAEGDFEAAADAYRQALAVFEAGDDLNNRFNARVDYARVSIALGAHEDARDSLGAAIRQIGEMGTTYRGHFALEATARLAAAREEWQLAARLQGASDGAVDTMGATRNWFDDAVLAQLHRRPHAMLGDEAYAAAYDAGRELRLEAALAHAAAWFDDPVAWPLRRVG